MLVFTLLACTGLFVQPQEGRYSVVVSNLESSAACDAWGYDAAALQNVDLTDVELSADGESVTFDDIVECDLFGADFDCNGYVENQVEDYDAWLVQENEIGGTWTSSGTFLADWQLSFYCDGPDCNDELETCRVTFDWHGAL